MASQKKTILWAIAAVALASFLGGAYFATHVEDFRKAAGLTAGAAGTGTNARDASNRASGDLLTVQSIELSEKDVAGVKPEPVREREFPIETPAVGSIEFNQDMTVWREREHNSCEALNGDFAIVSCRSNDAARRKRARIAADKNCKWPGQVFSQ